MKKVIILLSVILILVASAFSVFAVEPEVAPDPTLASQTRQLYTKCRSYAGRGSFQGMCGLMTSYQLWRLGVNTNLLIYDGNKQFDAYKELDATTGGHTVRAYSANEYSLQEALNRITSNGTRDAQNILVGFQWTNTTAGKAYGHCCVINYIQDGLVYYTESFGYVMGKPEGQVITCTIEEFAHYYSDWTKFEGCIDFGTKQYANTCQSYGTDLYVQLRFESNLRSQPCLIGKNDCQRLRSLSAGELLHASGVYISEDGDLFYRIDDGDVVGYVSANAVYLQMVNEQGVYLENPGIPTYIKPGKDPALTGTVRAESSQLQTLQLEITDENGAVVLQEHTSVEGRSCDMSVLSRQVALNKLAAGTYQGTLYAEVGYAMAEGAELTQTTIRQNIFQQTLCVGAEAPEEEEEKPETPTDGWFLEDGTWYCYENGQPRTGWVTKIGVDYFLNADGSVTTGWLKEDGRVRYFSETGALCSGWVTTWEGTYYFINDGVVACGLQQIGDKLYCFASDGRLLTKGTVTHEGIVYQINPDGTAT